MTEVTTGPTPDATLFDIRAPLPQGTTLLEASAGTGKTWTIGALVARYVAEGVATIEQLLVVTFGRAASQELRERVRDQLVELARALVDPAQADPDNDVVNLLLECDDSERVLRLRRVEAALAAFDSATIATTHQFCAMVLDSLGVAGDSDPRATLVEDLDQLTREVVDDLYLRATAYVDGPPAFTHSQAMDIARRVVDDPQAAIVPDRETLSENQLAGTIGRKVKFAHAVRAEVERRKRLMGVLSYDDLLTQLAIALEPEDSPARLRMRSRWSIVLVDEFQDTDPVQWQILQRAFDTHATMVLIGDPKQAIYAFRGGDVVTYLQAAKSAATHQTLGTNWRSDGPLVEALGSLLGGAALGDPQIVVRPVTAEHDESRLQGAPHPAPVRLRVLRRAELGSGGNRPVWMGTVRPWVARDVACDIRELLDSDATFEGRPLVASDVAVIAYRHHDLHDVRRALEAVGVRAVIAGGGSVFATPAAQSWLVYLEALEQPHRTPRVRAAALTPFVGFSAAELDAGGDVLTDSLADRLRGESEIFTRRGLAAVFESATSAGLGARVLGHVGGERLLTDLRHLGEVLHEAALAEQLGLVSLVGWLRAQITEARDGRGTERVRRLDSDASAVQLVTIHASKGLQYPVVYLPALGDRHVRDPSLPLFHDPEGRRCRNVSDGGPGWLDHLRWHEAEEDGESLRLAYVAMTRAQSQVVLWWTPGTNAPRSALHRLLAGRVPGRALVDGAVSVLSDDEMVDLARRWAGVGALWPERAVPVPPAGESERAILPELAVRSFTREIDTTWARRSYSSLTAAAHAAASASAALPSLSEPEEPGLDDEPALDDPVTTPSVTGDCDPATTVLSPMAALPVGATFGSLVHAILEHADPQAPQHDGDLRAEFATHLDEQFVQWPVEDLDTDALLDALVLISDTPLGPLADQRTLRELPRSDRLCELDFELPLDGGEDSSSSTPVLLGQIAALLRAHLPEGDPVRGYAESLDEPSLGEQVLRGYLTGSIDVALRVGERFLVVDYKTNWLGEFGQDAPALTLADYHPDRLDEAMSHSDYPLQALLYSLVLHRFLRWRLPDYDPERHLGGVLYLYLRGMAGPDTPTYDAHPTGVFSWRPPTALVVELSDLLQGGAR